MKSLKKTTLYSSLPLDTISPSELHYETYGHKFQSVYLHQLNALANRVQQIFTNVGNLTFRYIPEIFKKKYNKFAKQPSSVNKVQTGQVPFTDRLPFIKATTHINTYHKHDPNCSDHAVQHPLTGRCILCVGGRVILYPQYRHLVETSGGNFLTFHGKSNDSIDRLYALLTRANMVICPVDCVNHGAFYTVKHYCKQTGKPCVLLDRSAITTFRKGIEILASQS